jgi:hypothetical protein
MGSPIAPRPAPFLLLPLAALALGLALLRPPAQVLTPGGFRDASLVATVDWVQGDQAAAADLDGEPRALDRGWITFAHWTNDSGAPLRTFVTEWRVPSPPSTKRGQTLFLFNGLQNRGRNYGILQPVLQWGRSAAGGGDYWSIASWYVTSRGQAFHTPLVRVSPGDTLVGEMRLLGGTDGRFAYVSEFRGIPGTRLRVENIAELGWASESLEAYGVRRCTDYPASREHPFQSILLLTDRHPEMEWREENRVTTCGQHVRVVSHSSTDGRVDIRFRR